MTENEFRKVAQSAHNTFQEKMHLWHQDKPQAWQFLIQLNTDLPYDAKLTYDRRLPIDMCRMEDTLEKTRSIILWRLFQNGVDSETLRLIAEIIDGYVQQLERR